MSESELLKKLDYALAAIQWKGPPSDLSHLNCPIHLANFKELGDQEEVTSTRLIAHALDYAKTHFAADGESILRVCSIGCEDGTLDKIILQGLRAKQQVEYVGLDVDEQLCEAALENLSGVSPSVKVRTEMVDYEEEDLTRLGLEQFNLIWMVNCTYYASALAPLIKGATSLLKPTGQLLVISSSLQSIDQLITRFWCHQRPEHPLHTTESVVTTLTQLCLPYTISKEPITLNLTTPLKEVFSSPQSQLLLDHLVFSRLTDYPPEVRQLVVKFLQSIAKTNPDTCATSISSISDIITISHT